MNSQLIDSAARINGLIQQAQDHADKAKHHATLAITAAIEIGGELQAAKALHGPHGSWGDWLQDNCNLDRRTASRYVELSQLYPALTGDQREQVSDLSVRGAITRARTLLAPPPPIPKLATPANLPPPQKPAKLLEPGPPAGAVVIRQSNVYYSGGDGIYYVLQRLAPGYLGGPPQHHCQVTENLAAFLAALGADLSLAEHVGDGYMDELGLLPDCPEVVLDVLAGDIGAVSTLKIFQASAVLAQIDYWLAHTEDTDKADMIKTRKQVAARLDNLTRDAA